MRPLTRARKAVRPGQGVRINGGQLVMITVLGQIAHPIDRENPYRVGRDGVPRVLPGSGGIVLTHRIGDRCVGLAADHVEPGVSIRNENRSIKSADGSNQALQTYACVGNAAVACSGPASGAVGVVTGKHGGVDNVIVDFPLDAMKRMRIGDRVQVYAYGLGLRLLDFAEISVLNCAPRLLVRWQLASRDRKLRVPVTHRLPAGIMGSGLGRNNAYRGDCDIQLFDPVLRRRHRLGELRFGDLVAIEGADTRHGRSFHSTFTTVGVVIHSDSTVAGHGPGVTTLLSGPSSSFELIRDPNANLARVLAVRPPAAPQPQRTFVDQTARAPRRLSSRRHTAVPLPGLSMRVMS